MNQRQRSLRVLSKVSENALPPKQKEECKLVDQNQLRPFLEDLMKRYDKIAMDLQAAQHKVKIVISQILEYSEQNYKLLTENQQQTNVLKLKDEEIAYLYQRLSSSQEKFEKQLDVLSGDNGKVVGMLASKIEKLNAQLTEQNNEFEQTKSLLILREQEVLEWRSRRALEESKVQRELNQVKQTLVSKEQELSALRIKYEFKQKTSQSEQQDSWRQEQYIKSLTNQCVQCEILQNEITRMSEIIIQLRGENENMRQELVDYEWLKRRFNVQNVRI